MILFTGDIVNTHANEMHPWIDTFKRIKEHKYGKYSVLGNHDYGEYVTWPSEKEKETDTDTEEDGEEDGEKDGEEDGEQNGEQNGDQGGGAKKKKGSKVVKRALTTYNKFVKKNFAIMKKKFPNQKAPQIMQKVAIEWKIFKNK